VEVAEIVAVFGLDSAMIDMEHSPIGLDTAILDFGAATAIVPRVNSAAEAANIERITQGLAPLYQITVAERSHCEALLAQDRAPRANQAA
jgi:2-keto-3-deoxy-L-rhamnonate aldolase RhmA